MAERSKSVLPAYFADRQAARPSADVFRDASSFSRHQTTLRESRPCQVRVLLRSRILIRFTKTASVGACASLQQRSSRARFEACKAPPRFFFGNASSATRV